MLDPTTKNQKASPSHLQADKHTSEHIHWPTYCRCIFLQRAFLRVLNDSKSRGQMHTLPLERDICFYRKCRKISYNSGILHLFNKVSPELRTQKNGVKNATVTQWRTNTTLCPVCIWVEIIIWLDSYPGRTCDTPVNTVSVEHQKTEMTSHMKTKSLRSVKFSFGEERMRFLHKEVGTHFIWWEFPWNSI